MSFYLMTRTCRRIVNKNRYMYAFIYLRFCMCVCITLCIHTYNNIRIYKKCYIFKKNLVLYYICKISMIFPLYINNFVNSPVGCQQLQQKYITRYMHFWKAYNHVIYGGINPPKMKHLGETNPTRNKVSGVTLKKSLLTPLVSHFITNGPPRFQNMNKPPSVTPTFFHP